MQTSRRKFIDILFSTGIIGTIGAIVYPVANFLTPPENREPKVSSLKIGNISDFELNSSKIVKFGRTPVIVIRDNFGNLKALAATCTHLDCIVQYRKDTKQIICACHNGIYDLSGRNLSGPPPKPLEEFKVTLVEDEIIVSSQSS
jgi:Rieske Fe-S protein